MKERIQWWWPSDATCAFALFSRHPTTVNQLFKPYQRCCVNDDSLTLRGCAGVPADAGGGCGTGAQAAGAGTGPADPDRHAAGLGAGAAVGAAQLAHGRGAGGVVGLDPRPVRSAQGSAGPHLRTRRPGHEVRSAPSLATFIHQLFVLTVSVHIDAVLIISTFSLSCLTVFSNIYFCKMYVM